VLLACLPLKLQPPADSQMVESCCNYIPLVSDAIIAMMGIQIDPKEEEKLMGIKREVATTGHPYVGERSMETWCHEVGRMVL
jgi:hypothetical protein